MNPDKADPEPDEDDIESLWCLMNVRCPVHGDMVMMQGIDGKMLFWCGCIRRKELLNWGV